MATKYANDEQIETLDEAADIAEKFLEYLHRFWLDWIYKYVNDMPECASANLKYFMAANGGMICGKIAHAKTPKKVRLETLKKMKELLQTTIKMVEEEV